MSRSRLRDARGFTLVEALIVVAVLGVVLGAMATLLSSIYATGNQTILAGTTQDEARAAVDTLVADLRQAYTGDSSMSPVASMSGMSITFYSPDRQQPFHLRKLAYQLSGSSLQRASVASSNASDTGPPWSGLTTLGPWVTLVKSVVANPGGTAFLTYQKIDGSIATQPQDVARVTVTLTVLQTGSRRSATTYQSSATLREAS